VISVELDRLVRGRLSAKLAKFADRIERMSVRFSDVNGPRGGVDVVCRAKVVVSGLPSVVVDAQAETDVLAFGQVADAVERAVRRALERAGKGRRGHSWKGDSGRKRAGARPEASASRAAPPDAGSLIGRRVGRGPDNLKAALDRPEKRRRDGSVDTASPGVSATDRKAGGNSTARRNTLRSAPRATATLEDSRQTTPSRKSTRKSANRAKSGTNLQKKALARTTSSTARARRARAARA
jgi:hypothetical protein